MNRKVVLGLDTSNYTTSLAIMDLNGELLYDARKVLPVEKGKKGLRQSDALFHHMKHLPILAKEIANKASGFNIVAISGSTKPRSVQESYMPVFLASQSYAQFLSELWGIPFYDFSHQDGHIAAGLWAEKLHIEESFLVIQISGGTTELLIVEQLQCGYKTEIIGATSDISAGQLIDRIGTKMGLSFPAGVHLEDMAQNICNVNFNIPISITNNMVSFSGPETYFSRLIDDGFENNEIAYATINCVAKSLASLTLNALKQHPCKKLLIVGGVASNGQIRSYLVDKLSNEGVEVYFAQPKYCTDNAVGIVALGVSKYNQKNSIIHREV